MKKVFLSLFTLLVLTTGLFAENEYFFQQEYDDVVLSVGGEIGVASSILGRIFPEESIAFQAYFPSGFHLDFEGRFYENILRGKKESFIYGAPVFYLGYKWIYLGAGPLFEYDSYAKQFNTTITATAGAELGNWIVNNTRISLKLGLEESFRLLNLADKDSEDSRIDIFTSLIGTILSVFPMPYVGVKIYFPLSY